MDAPVRRRHEHTSEAASASAEARLIHDGNVDGDINDDGNDGFEGLPVVSDNRELLKRGICRVQLPEELDTDRWADELTQVTPMILGFEGDGEYAFYRNILDEPEFPFDAILLGSGSGGEDRGKASEPESRTQGEVSDIGMSALRYFPILPSEPERTKPGADIRGILSRELRLDDAFCVHYNMDQDDTSGSKHMDPSDITVNMCLHKSKDAKGSYVLFHGTKNLENLDADNTNRHTDVGFRETGGESECNPAAAPNRTNDGSVDIAIINDNEAPNLAPTPAREDRFLVPQLPGYATIHFGDHPHETTPLRQGSRTNIIMTYIYKDPTRSDAATRSCY